MKAFTAPLTEYSEFVGIQKEIDRKNLPVFVSGCIESQKSHLMYGLAENYPFRLIVTYSEQKAKEICEDFKLYDNEVLYYPAKDIIFYNADIHGNAIVKSRMQVLKRLAERKPITVVVSLDAGMDRLIPVQMFINHIVTLHEGDTLEQEPFLRTLVRLGYERQGQVEAPGEFAVRGGIIDVYPLTEDTPFRIDLWGDEIDTIRSFDVTNQRSIERVPSLTIYPATEFVLTDEQMAAGTAHIRKECEKTDCALKKQDKIEEAARLRRTIAEFLENLDYLKSAVGLDSYVGYFYEETQSFFDYFNNEESIIFLDEPARLAEKGKAVLTEFTDSMQGRLEKGYILPGQADAIYDYKELFAKLSRGNTVMLGTMEQKETLLTPKVKFALTVGGVSAYNNNFEILVKDLTKWKKAGYRVILLSASRTRAARLAEDLREFELSAFYAEKAVRPLQPGEIMVTTGNVHRGFEYPLLKFTIISESDIFGATAKKTKKRKHNYEGTQINSFSDLCAGDYVVHENHGLGIYRGIEKLEVDKATKDYIKIEYGDGGVLFLPATGLDVIQKYAGSDAKKPKLNKLNSVEWKNTKARVKTAVRELAEELVQLYALRQKKEGFRFDRDTVWQNEFEEMFPFEETDDQLKAIEDTKRDMESGRIMDRLVCGDVGYGKTEIALRAAFKAVQSGKQVAVLVPTTILAQQHYNTFSQRMKDFPVTIEMLSRFRTAAEQKKIIADTEKGRVDILIGTHRLLSKDISFKSLGLLVVDEEQRFGVTHKERIKHMKNDIDVLTLTATPIPRTLHMSLVGIRDMSVLDEPPVDRLPIQTFVMEHNDEIIREAIERELGRDGQVYYVYNRVNGIDEVANRIAALVPDANVAYAHGKMQERTLEKIMHDFINGEIDVLISTTIIETGLDISNVNTIIIDDADRLGLSQMYQLRGRVGRSSRTAYAFLMYKRDKMLKEIAEKRLSAIREFTELGSGFKIAMRDLEIRGAGTLLGEAQSGHMEAVGYDLYCKMLNEAVKHLKDDTPQEEGFETEIDINVDAYIPSTYVKNEMQKLELYKRIALIANEEEYADMQEELMDRFGDIPNSVENLLRIALIKAQAHEVYVSELQHKGAEVKFILFQKAKLAVEKIPDFLATQENRVRFVPGASPAFVYKLKTGIAAASGTATASKKGAASGVKKSPVEQLFDQVSEVLAAMKRELL